MDKNLLKNQIEEAFSGLHYPGDHDLTVHPLGFDEVFYESLINNELETIRFKTIELSP